MIRKVILPLLNNNCAMIRFVIRHLLKNSRWIISNFIQLLLKENRVMKSNSFQHLLNKNCLFNTYLTPFLSKLKGYIINRLNYRSGFNVRMINIYIIDDFMDNIYNNLHHYLDKFKLCKYQLWLLSILLYQNKT